MQQWATIFDVDGVIVDSASAHCTSWQRMFAEHDLSFSEAQFRETFGRKATEIIDLYFPGRFDNEQIQRMSQRKGEIFRELVAARYPEMPGARALTRRLLDEGVKVAFASSGPPENVRLAAVKLDLIDELGALICGTDVTRGKPDPQVFQLAAERMAIAPSACVVIEDAPAGIAAARAAGMVAVGLTSQHPAAALTEAGATRVVDSLNALNPAALHDLLQPTPAD